MCFFLCVCEVFVAAWNNSAGCAGIPFFFVVVVHGKNKIPHGKTKNLTAKTKYLTAKPKTSRQKQNTSRQNQKPHGKNKIPLGKTKNLTAKPNTSQQKQYSFVFAVRFLFLPWGFRFCREVFGFAVTVVGHRILQLECLTYLPKMNLFPRTAFLPEGFENGIIQKVLDWRLYGVGQHFTFWRFSRKWKFFGNFHCDFRKCFTKGLFLTENEVFRNFSFDGEFSIFTDSQLQ